MRQSINGASCELLGAFLATLAHPTRMRIFCALQSDAKTVTEIANEAGISITNASQHLRMMRDRGALTAEKRAHNVYYRIADPRFVEAAMLIREALSERLRERAEDASAQGDEDLSTSVIASPRGHADHTGVIE
jgi:DNA-binding transcriptional ArsR family regulator